MKFTDLGLSEPILRAVREQGYETPTPIQQQAIPMVLSGGDLLAGAQTGTGKTAGFTLPLLHRLMLSQKPSAKRTVRALVLTPTRELAAQVEENVRAYGKHLPLKSMVMFGGVGMNPQIDALRRGVDILVATPGRLLDIHQQGHLDLRHVEILVLDEADRMLDMGFIHDIKKVLALLPATKQSLLFSATFSDDIKALADRLLKSPQHIEVARRNATADTVAQRVYWTGRERKKDLLAHLIQSNDWHQVLVFTRMKHGANRLAEFLVKQGVTAMAIHGNKSQGARTKALSEFKTGTLQVLVATDIAARGIDIDELPHVVNFELPNVPEDYVHRIGRTGRAGCEGEAVSLVCPDEELFLKDIERLIKRNLPRETLAGYDVPAGEKAEPIQIGRQTIGVRAARGAKPAAPHGRPPRAPQHAPQSRGGQPKSAAPRAPGMGPTGPNGAARGAAKPGNPAAKPGPHPAHDPRRDARPGARPGERTDGRPARNGDRPAALLGGRPPRNPAR
ncbi:DEAD/DEAH box helicase [Inhella gelatinilytica]|uniref:ATP-dependent RNA helicase RhlE n=1 Tax=Inhella gelatinilytica TaxID=2795030 RepID=A0A931NEJ8_9BURK|nr:DEAD/DEAH box helicase [Inhella gelatinilytica]MBH9553759.1 DEAD/DEAH box helicase [Inhella gelatinilytica]